MPCLLPDMKALLMLSVFFICGCAQKAVLNTQLSPEPKEIAETDSAGNFISAAMIKFYYIPLNT
jgi:hypothetical protein